MKVQDLQKNPIPFPQIHSGSNNDRHGNYPTKKQPKLGCPIARILNRFPTLLFLTNDEEKASTTVVPINPKMRSN
jgi:hypothetical protein